MLSHNRLASFFEEATNGLVSPSEATINSFLQEAATNADTEPLIADLLAGHVMGVDDTAMRSTERPVEDGKGNLVTDEDEAIKMETAENKSFQVCVRTYSNETTKREFELEQEIVALKLRIKELEQLVEELMAKLNKNSSNSSKPPSSDGLKKSNYSVVVPIFV